MDAVLDDGAGCGPGWVSLGATPSLDSAFLKGRWFFACGFAKNERDNIEDDAEAALKKLVVMFLTMPPQALTKALEAEN